MYYYLLYKFYKFCHRPSRAIPIQALYAEIQNEKRKELLFKNKPPRSLFCLSLSNPFRRQCIRIADSRSFDNFILLTIFANCAALGCYKPLGGEDNSKTNETLEQIEMLFLVIFTMECMIRIVASGFFFHPNAYRNDEKFEK